MFNKIEYPNCDNCGRPIKTFGIHIVDDGRIIYVHETYNKVTKKCSTQELEKDITD